MSPQDQQPTGGAAATPAQAPSGVSQMSDAEYNAALQESLNRTNGVDPNAPPSTRQPLGFWRRLYHSLNRLAGGEGPGSQVDEATLLGKSALRGAGQAANAVGGTILQGAAAVDRYTGLGEALQPGYNAAYDEAGGVKNFLPADELQAVSEDDMNLAFGPKTDDPLANFAEGASQWFATGTLLGLGKYIMAAPTHLSFYAAGAVTDAVGFDPYEAQLAELAARAPNWTGVGLLGKLLSVNGDDSQIVARLKRAAAGAISNAVLDGLIASARMIRSARTLSNPAATAAEKAAARSTVAQATQTLQDVKDGTHVTPGDVVSVAPTADGRYTLVPSQELPNGNPSLLDQRAAADMETSTFHRNGNGTEGKITTQAPEGVGNPPPNPDLVLQSKADAVARMSPDARQAFLDGLPPEEKAAIQDRLDHLSVRDEVAAAAASDGPVFTSRGEAETNAAIINDGARAHIDAQLTPADVEAHVETAKALVKSENPADVVRLMDGTHFNFSYMAAPDAVRAQIEAISKRWSQAMESARGKLSHDEILQMANDAIGGITPEEALGVFQQGKGKLDEGVRIVIGNRVLQEMSERMSKFSDLLDARPGDAVLHEQAKSALELFYQTMRDVSGAESAAGRALDAIKLRLHPKFKEINLRESGTAPVDAPTGGSSLEATTPGSEAVAEPPLANAQDLLQAKDAIDVLRRNVERVRRKSARTTDTANPAVNAEDFSLARARRRAELAMQRLENAGKPAEINPAAASKRGQNVLDAANAQRAEPLTAPDVTLPKPQTNPIEDLSKWIDQSNAQLDREIARFRGEGKAKPTPANPSSFSPTGKGPTPFEGLLKEAKNSKEITAGMTHREIAAQVRMIKMAGGAPRDALAVAHAAQVVHDTGNLAKAFEVFVNFALSGPRTIKTVLGSGALINVFEPAVRILAGAGSFNKALVREGADIFYGNFKYLSDNLRSAWMSFKAGHSIINPQPVHKAIGGLTGEVVRVPGRVVAAGDEFTRVTAYRARVRAASLRLGREQGLTGPSLAARVDQDLRAAFDPATGIAKLPEALRYAEVPTFSGALGRGTLGGDLQNWIVNHTSVAFLSPFQKASTNIFRYNFKSIPGLNLMYRDVREALARGGEEASIINARSAMASSIVGLGAYMYMADNLTGRGPADPAKRSLWLKSHQPYSFRWGSDQPWHSYARLDPIAQSLGILADGMMAYHEQNDGSSDASDLLYAMAASTFNDLSSKSQVGGLLSFADAWTSHDPSAPQRWLTNFGASALVPNAANQMNPDSVQRDTRNFIDAVMARTPFLSEQLPPRFSWLGEPQMKAEGWWNRQSLLQTQASTGNNTLEDRLLVLNKGFDPMASHLFGGLIDLKDPKAFDNGTHVAPYTRAMQLLSSPPASSGRQSLRQTVEEILKDNPDASTGSQLFPGGKIWLKVAGKKTGMEAWALHQLQQEYPKLDSAIRMYRRMQGASIQSGEAGVQDVQKEFGVLSR